MVLLTNASMFHRPHVQRGLTILDANQGEIWAKLDAGTAAYFEQIDRTRIGFARILQNLREAACVRPLVIQALFLRLHGQPPPYGELEAFCERLNDITAAGGTLSLVQVYTIARPPAEPMVTPLTDAEVDAIAELVRARTGLPVAAFYGTTGVRTA
jgi:wyosine [tRNA(Phe)-imidazoG37] synthetase (radical SAM superfamily)